MSKHKTFRANQYDPKFVKYIRAFAQAFDDGNLNPKNALTKAQKNATRKEQISRGYDVLLDILEKDPQYLSTVEAGIYEYARTHNNPAEGVRVNDLYAQRGTLHAKHLSSMIRWEASNNIYYSPTAKSILFLKDADYVDSYDGLTRSLLEHSYRLEDERQLQQEKTTKELQAQAFITAFRKAALADPTNPLPHDAANKEDLERLWALGQSVFTALQTAPKTPLKPTLSENDLAQLGQTYYQEYRVSQEQQEPIPSKIIVKLDPSIQPTTAVSNTDAMKAYANGWYDGAEKEMDEATRKQYAQAIMADGVAAFRDRITPPEKRTTPLPQKLVDYVGYDTYNLQGRTIDEIRFDGQLHFASINNAMLFDQLTQLEAPTTQQPSVQPDLLNNA